MEPLTAAPLTVAAARAQLAAAAFLPGVPGPVGVEAEFFVVDPAAPVRIPSLDELGALLAGADVASRLTYEPGGQLELSAPPAAGPLAAIALLRKDIAVVCGLLGRAGLVLQGGGCDATRSPSRQLRTPRYDAMAAHFAALGEPSASAGPVMMTATASVQLNLEAGADPAEIERRWARAHTIGPTLAATFACSPVLAGRATGAASSRLANWLALDPGRTAPVPFARPDLPAAQQWAAYALDATAVVIPADGPTGAPIPLRDWISDPGLVGRPATAADVAAHATTLFPPVRPRGFLELRYLDGQRLEHLDVLVAVGTVLHDDPLAAPAAAEACAPAAERWGEAARCGLADEALRTAAQACLGLARAALERAGASTALLDDVAAFADRYTDRGRTPADDTHPGPPVVLDVTDAHRAGAL